MYVLDSDNFPIYGRVKSMIVLWRQPCNGQGTRAIVLDGLEGIVVCIFADEEVRNGELLPFYPKKVRLPWGT